MRSREVIRAADFGARSQRRVAIAVSLLLNLAFVFLLRIGSEPHRGGESMRGPRALMVRLIDAPPRPQDSPTLPVAPNSDTPSSARTTRRVPSRPTIALPSAPTEAASESDVSPPPKLFDPDGRIALPEPSPPRARFVEPSRKADALTRREALPYAPTRFDRVWTPDDETLGGEILRKSVVSHTWRTPWGGQVRCSTSLLLGGILGGCGWGHAPSATAEELAAMRADPPPSPGADALQAH